MLLTWMLIASVFTLCVGAAAHAISELLRSHRRATRSVWAVALGVAVIWPLAVPVLRPLMLAASATTAMPVDTGSTATPVIATATSAPALSWLEQLVHTISASPIAVERSVNAWGNAVPWLGTLLLSTWALLSTALLLRLLLATRRLRAMTRRAIRATVDQQEVLLADTFGPATVGVRQPRIVLPQWVLALDAPLRALVLQHEREHCASGDPRFVWGAALATALMPWNPGVWWLARRLRLALELDCDVRTLRLGGDPLVYAKLLLFMTQQHAAPASHLRLASSLAASRSHLSRRIVAMQEHPLTTARTVRLAVGGLAVILIAAACGSRIPGNAVAPDSADNQTAIVAQSPTDSATASAALGSDSTIGNPYFEFQVQKPVALTTSGSLAYPEMLKAAQVEGTVLASFVVDEQGVVDTSTFKVLRSDHELFSNSVRLALSQFTYSAAEVGGKRVKQLVEQPFVFSLDKSRSATAKELERKRAAREREVAAREREVAAFEAQQSQLPKKPSDPSLPYFEYQVEKPAAMSSGGFGMVYPPELRSARVEGTVLASFVVDTNGQVEMGTFKVLKSDHALFTAAVKEALQSAKYLPAEVEGKRVRQLVQQPFRFSLDR